LIGGPEARGVGREHFINQDQFTVEQAELKLRIRDDDAAFAGVGAGSGVNLEA
jgi:hypothetical protein